MKVFERFVLNSAERKIRARAPFSLPLASLASMAISLY